VLKAYLLAFAAWLLILLLLAAVATYFYGQSQEREWQKLLPERILHQ
jgi:hypothetical protein